MLDYLKEKADQVEEFATDIIMDRRHGRVLKPLFALLYLLSLVFRFIAQSRLFLYKNRILKSRSLGCLVVVVGNLTVGGTGKTPIVEKFAKHLTARGRKVAILSRGYKSKAEPLYRRFWRWIMHRDPSPPKIVSDGRNVLLNSTIAGDEPYMLARNLPGVVVLADKDRVKAGKYAVEKFGADTLLLDDGFQYLSLKGRLNLLLIDKTNPFGNSCLLPRGILREPISHLKRASYVFVTKSDGQEDAHLEATIRRYHPTVEIIECAHRPEYLQSINNGDEHIMLSSLKGSKVAAFSGIAVPESFESILKNNGAELVLVKRFVDHHRFTYSEMEDFFLTAEELNVSMIITTEKDAVRIPKIMKSPMPMYFLRLEIDILKGKDDFEKALDAICFPKNEIPAARLTA